MDISYEDKLAFDFATTQAVIRKIARLIEEQNGLIDFHTGELSVPEGLLRSEEGK